jgi:hypothetical protein
VFEWLRNVSAVVALGGRRALSAVGGSGSRQIANRYGRHSGQLDRKVATVDEIQERSLVGRSHSVVKRELWVILQSPCGRWPNSSHDSITRVAKISTLAMLLC